MNKELIFKTIFKIPKMDCPSEERIIRMKLEDNKRIKNLEFNIPGRELLIIHTGTSEEILKALTPLNFGAEIKSSVISTEAWSDSNERSSAQERSLLKKLIAINGSMFLVEFITGVFAQSMGLISDSLDMLADAGIYGISLYAVGRSIEIKKKSAITNGAFQLFLGMGIMVETARRFIFGSDPEASYMILVSLVALAANVYCLALLSKHKDGEVHMKASYICSSTDVMANAGVILAGTLVYLTKSPYPDLIIGVIVTGIVLRGAVTILKLGR